jgi:hypothetical protein
MFSAATVHKQLRRQGLLNPLGHAGCNIHDCFEDSIMFAYESNVTMRNTLFQNNVAPAASGVMKIGDSTAVSLSDVYFTNNTKYDVFFEQKSSLLFYQGSTTPLVPNPSGMGGQENIAPWAPELQSTFLQRNDPVYEKLRLVRVPTSVTPLLFPFSLMLHLPFLWNSY